METTHTLNDATTVATTGKKRGRKPIDVIWRKRHTYTINISPYELALYGGIDELRYGFIEADLKLREAQFAADSQVNPDLIRNREALAEAIIVAQLEHKEELAEKRKAKKEAKKQ